MFSFNEIIIQFKFESFSPKLRRNRQRLRPRSRKRSGSDRKTTNLGAQDVNAPHQKGLRVSLPRQKRAEKGAKKATPVASTAPPTEPPTSPVVKGIKRAESSSPYILARTAAKSAAYIPQVNPIKTSHYFWRKFVPKARRISHPA